VPAAIVSASVFDQGPAGSVENVPVAELELNVTESGTGVVMGCPEPLSRVRRIAADAVPAGIV
jgi:hypothetical protein